MLRKKRNYFFVSHKNEILFFFETCYINNNISPWRNIQNNVQNKSWGCMKNNFVSKQKVACCTKSHLVSTKTSWCCTRNCFMSTKTRWCCTKIILCSKKLLIFFPNGAPYQSRKTNIYFANKIKIDIVKITSKIIFQDRKMILKWLLTLK